ncbi:T3SS (YopN, CesT) and YbjN peptide-binding chaperone 1 [Rhodococcoides kyotonense]|uniref:YbjN domain-containing protein n=1 Tax=Rhodococcoides kyotonense TaxID=398843 RepID=A0A239ICZ1_9NOCA|nr:hypothetical protein [Rhodococcus kyotonensis]SNS91441.1 hypothetical protein SAMN05421642_1072 [Rhodococcus kyotonensis]
MSTFEAEELDRSTDDDWRTFSSRLADHLIDDSDDVVLDPAFSPSGTPPREIRFRRTSADTIECTITTASDTRTIEKSTARVDHLVALAVAELRGTWNVVHPAFLAGLDRAPEMRLGDADDYDATSCVTAAHESDLERIVRQCLRAVTGSDIEVSPDGNFAISLGTITAYVYVADRTEVRVHAPIVERISGRTRAAELVSDLNRRHPRLKFLLVDDRVHVTVSIDASPFVPQHLDDALHRVAEFVGRVDEQFADHMGGAIACGAVAAPAAGSVTYAGDNNDDVPPQLMTLLELDSVADGAVDVEVVVSVCGPDREKIASYESFCSEQARTWRECARDAEERGDVDTMSECEAEAVPWDRIVSILRLVLRTVAFFDNA